jgi:hypothetical protein
MNREDTLAGIDQNGAVVSVRSQWNRLQIDPTVEAFLQRRGIEDTFDSVCNMLHDCFPDKKTWTIFLEEDYDDPDWIRVVCEVALPAPRKLAERLGQEQRFFERFVREIPNDVILFFSPRFTSAQE